MKDKFVHGQVLNGRFRTVAPLNHGSFGMVFLAKDLETGNDVAIKCLTKASSGEASGTLTVDDRSEELECHRRLKHHPNIVNLIHSFETSAHIFLVLEYCANGDLYEAIRLDRGPLETEHVRDFMLQLVSAVEFMHANGLYHRDIKPENIFLMQDGTMKLGDFGLATRGEWCYEACVGSDRYMAPEQYEPGAAGYSPAKADIWAIGICLLNILFARNPFVTPTESDILFSDYARDRQSLFDVFPNMSQDTFEILSHALAPDPEKRSLSRVRAAILRTVSFTTDDESLDEFCTEGREFLVPATANREPLRTPSIQSPQISTADSFPWAKALHASPPQTTRQLSVIPDTESYTEDLFPPSETAGTSWFSVHAETPSMASVLDSAMGDSLKQRTTARRPRATAYPPASDPVPITGSLPSHVFKPLPSLAMVFGKHKDEQHISKSWSDLWDEEESENEDLVLQQRREQNSRSWSQESRDLPQPDSPHGLRELDPSAVVNARSHASGAAVDNSPLSNKEIDCASPSSTKSPRPIRPGSPKSSSHVDKWAALGDKRRKYKPNDPQQQQKKKNYLLQSNWRKDWGLGSSGFDTTGGLTKDQQPSPQHDRRRRLFLERDWRRDANVDVTKPLSGYDGSVDEDLDLVGGWHDLHL